MFVVTVASVLNYGYNSCLYPARAVVSLAVFVVCICVSCSLAVFPFPCPLIVRQFVECHLRPESLSGCRHSNTHTYTHTCFVEQMVYRALLCPCVWFLCSWSAVGSPLTTLIWLGKHSYLIRQLFFLTSQRAEWTFNLAPIFAGTHVGIRHIFNFEIEIFNQKL